MTDLVDPGWKPALPALVPLLGRVIASRTHPYIVVMRALWLSFASSIVWIAVVVALLTSSSDPTGSAAVAYAAVAAALVVDIIGTLSVRRRRARVDATSNDVGTYRTYFFLCVVFSELPALVGFGLAILTSRAAAYYLGGLIALLGFALVAPTRRFVAAQGPTFKLAVLTPPGG